MNFYCFITEWPSHLLYLLDADCVLSTSAAKKLITLLYEVSLIRHKKYNLTVKKARRKNFQGKKDFIRALDFYDCSLIVCFETGSYIAQASPYLDMYVRMILNS